MQITNNVVGLVLRQDNALVDQTHRRPLRITISVEFLKDDERVFRSRRRPRHHGTAIRGSGNLWVVGAGRTGGHLNTIQVPKAVARLGLIFVTVTCWFAPSRVSRKANKRIALAIDIEAIVFGRPIR